MTRRALWIAATASLAAAWAWRALRNSPQVGAARTTPVTAKAAGRKAPGGATSRAERKQPTSYHWPTRPFFVANPTKAGVPELRDLVTKMANRYAIPIPTWLFTTREDCGLSQAAAAVSQGADLVVVVGGDGTVRAVATALAGTDIPLAIVPMGTGNLLARNLGLPLDDPYRALQIALFGATRTIDVGRLRMRITTRNRHTTFADHLFLVIAGVGFDASMIADTREDLKRILGWPAYFVGAFWNMRNKRTLMHIWSDASAPFTRRWRTVMVGNCGKLPGQLTLIPDAEIDDGLLDVAAVDTRVGLIGWWHLYGQVMLQSLGIRFRGPGAAGEIEVWQTKRIRIETGRSEKVQADGEVLGTSNQVVAWVDPQALKVRVASVAAS